MSSPKRMTEFFESEKGMTARQILGSMVDDDTYNTQPTYTPNTEMYPNNKKTFVETHMDYLGTHLDVNPDQYLSNLRLITRVN